MKKLKLFTVLLAMLILVTPVLTACGSGDNDDTLVIYDGQFSEMRIIHQMVKLLVEQDTDLTVEIRDEMAPPASYDQVVAGEADLTNSYDGTLLTTFLHLDPVDVPEGMTLYDFVNEQALEQDNTRLLGKLGTNNTYAVAAPQHIIDQYQLETISDLAEVADELVFAAEHDFFTEEGSAKYNPMVEFYDLDFKEGRQIDISLKYSAINSGEVDVTVVYATDGLNKEAELVILEDDRNFFPEYNGALLVNDDIFEKFEEKAPNLEEVLEQLTGQISDEEMVDMTYATDVGIDGETSTPEAEARKFLEAKGLLK
ncbi:MAG: glycine/betaine ABC transporter substrate-binding protein [Clostridiaceae bacterium]|nr:glycine/betaine ABC transporter substrate-binding protein [Clostridiaceae bacterium]